MATEQQIAANRLNAWNNEPVRPYPRNAKAPEALLVGVPPKQQENLPHERLASRTHRSTRCQDSRRAGSPRLFLRRDRLQSRARRRHRATVRAVRRRRPLASQSRPMHGEQLLRPRSFQAADDIAIAENPEIRLALADARAFVDTTTRFQLLTIYERRIHANMSRSLKQLTDLKTARLALEAREQTEANAQREEVLEQARLLTQLAEMEGEPCDIATEYPQLIGFVFSDAEIAQAIYFAGRLKQPNAPNPPTGTHPSGASHKRSSLGGSV
jgi:hypothetical protein